MRDRYYLENTNFIFPTNWSGDPKRDTTYHSSERKGNFKINDPELVQEMIDDGFNVRVTRPEPGREEDFIPEYFVKATLKFRSEGGAGNPVVCLVNKDGYAVDLDEDSVVEIDKCRIKRNSVCATLSPYTKGSHPTLYVKELYVTQEIDDDHWSDRFPRRPRD